MIFAVTIYRNKEKTRIRGNLFKVEVKRTYTSVIAKVALPTMAAVLGQVGMFVSSVSFGIADSFANEIGILSKEKPRLITNMERVRPGTNGAVSPLGTLASGVGSFVIGLIASCLGFFGAGLPIDLIFVIIMGVLGSTIDSFMGATLENRGLINGWQVNSLTSLIIGLIGSYTFELLIL